MKTFDEFINEEYRYSVLPISGKRTKIHSKKEIQEFYEKFGAPHGCSTQELIKFIADIGIFWGKYKTQFTKTDYERQTWKVKVYQASAKLPDDSGNYVYLRVRNFPSNVRDNYYLHIWDDNHKKILFKNQSEAYEFLLSYIMNTVKFKDDISVEEALKKKRECEVAKASKNFNI